MEENYNITKTDGEYLYRICNLTSKAAAGTDFGNKFGSLCQRLNCEISKPSHLPVSLSAEEKNLAATSVMLYKLLIRERYDVIRDHFHMEKTGVSAEEVKEKNAEIEAFLREKDLNTRELQKKLRNEKKTPARKLYISDLHFFHDNLNRRMDMRGFHDFEVMNSYMLQQWNDHVTKKDEVFILGDFSISRGEAANKILEQLNGKKYLIEGNHDKFLKDKAFDRSLFEWIKPYAEIQDSKRQVILSHYPVFCYKGQYRTKPNGDPVTYMLYGHVHNTHDEKLVNEFIRITKETRVSSKNESNRPIPCNMINCFCMFSDYIPLTLDDWIRLDAERRKNIEAHPQT